MELLVIRTGFEVCICQAVILIPMQGNLDNVVKESLLDSVLLVRAYRFKGVS